MNNLTRILNIFTDHLIDIPMNLRNSALALLGVLTILDIANQIFDVDSIDWEKWIKKKIIRVGILTWLITQYTYILSEVMDGFIKIGNLALNKNISSNKFLDNPSLLIDKAWELGDSVLSSTTLTSPSTWINIIIWAFIIISFLFIALQIILTWIEFYLLTGISIIFIPFGTIKVGEIYYQNVLKTIIGVSIKMLILNLLLILSEDIIKGLKITNDSTQGFLQVLGSLAILAYLILKIPDMGASLLTGSPTFNASSALQSGVSAAKGALAGAALGMAAAGKTVNTGKDIASGASKGMDTGGNIGGQVGGAVGTLFGPTGTAVGQKIGATVGSVAGAVGGGAYSSAKLAGGAIKSASGIGKKENNSTDKKNMSNETNKGSSKKTSESPSNDTGTKQGASNETSSDNEKTETENSPNTTNGTENKDRSPNIASSDNKKADTGSSSNTTSDIKDTSHKASSNNEKINTGSPSNATTSTSSKDSSKITLLNGVPYEK